MTEINDILWKYSGTNMTSQAAVQCKMALLILPLVLIVVFIPCRTPIPQTRWWLWRRRWHEGDVSSPLLSSCVSDKEMSSNRIITRVGKEVYRDYTTTGTGSEEERENNIASTWLSVSVCKTIQPCRVSPSVSRCSAMKSLSLAPLIIIILVLLGVLQDAQPLRVGGEHSIAPRS